MKAILVFLSLFMAFSASADEDFWTSLSAVIGFPEANPFDLQYERTNPIHYLDFDQPNYYRNHNRELRDLLGDLDEEGPFKFCTSSFIACNILSSSSESHFLNELANKESEIIGENKKKADLIRNQFQEDLKRLRSGEAPIHKVTLDYMARKSRAAMIQANSRLEDAQNRSKKAKKAKQQLIAQQEIVDGKKKAGTALNPTLPSGAYDQEWQPVSPTSEYYRAIQTTRNKIEEGYRLLDRNDYDSKPERRQLLRVSELNTDIADMAFGVGDNRRGNFHLGMARQLADVAVSLIPFVSLGQDLLTLASGMNYITGEEVSDIERSVILGTLFLPSFISGSVKGGTKIAKILSKLAKSDKPSSDLANSIGKSLQNAEESLRHGNRKPCRLFSSNVSSSILKWAIALFFIQPAYANDDCLPVGQTLGETFDSAGKHKINLKNIDANRLKNNPLNETKYSRKVQDQMQLGDYHAFPKEVDNFAGLGTKKPLVGGDGISRTKIDLPGSYDGKNGHFEWIIEPNSEISHRLFVPKR